MNATIGQCKEILVRHYGSRLESVILFGSTARGQGSPESDIDLLVVLRGDIDYFKELHTLAHLLYPAQLESDRLISAKPVALTDYKSGKWQLYRTIQREGVLA